MTSRVSSLGRGGKEEAQHGVQEHQGRSRDFPETPTGSGEPGGPPDPLGPPVSEPQQTRANLYPPASACGGGAIGGLAIAGPRGAGRVGAGPGRQAPDARLGTPRRRPASASPGLGAAGALQPGKGAAGRRGGPGTAPLREGTGGDEDARGERRLPQAQRRTLVEPGRIFSPPRRRERGRATPGDDPSPADHEGTGARPGVATPSGGRRCLSASRAPAPASPEEHPSLFLLGPWTRAAPQQVKRWAHFPASPRG